uniref:Uncharacterized protein n=1 Tax=Phytophthora fragariae TaxID=53985 RepID=A0A6A3DCT0_9STRA|nr:hypothetical protein PF009_g30272 [Phytophthora fragariae]
MLSPHGLSSTVDNIKRRREKRYYKLLCLFADQVCQRRLANPLYLAPMPPPADQYCAKQRPVGAETLSAAWMQSSRIYSSVCEKVMRCTDVRKALRMDHSVKFCKRLKVWPGGTGKRESIKDAKMLLLLQNEIGQIVGRRLTRSENNDETRELLEHVKGPLLAAEDGQERLLISDNVNAVRNMVSSVFGASVGVRQDPFHIIQRFTEKVKDKAAKKQLCTRLHDAIYSVDDQLRMPEEMAARVRDAVAAVAIRDVSCPESEWISCLNSNLEQIECGDVDVKDNSYDEGGGKSVRVLSTSQLEGFHSALKKLLARSVSAEIGLRILDVFILRHNLKIGSRYGCNPPLEHADIATLAQAASFCRDVISESPQLEFVSKLLSTKLVSPQYRSVTEHDFGFEQWGQLFETAQVDLAALETNLHRAQQHSANIKELLSMQAVFSTTSRLPKAAFFNSLCTTELDYEAATGFSSQEFALLRHLRAEQLSSARSWDKCALVTTIMFNVVVTSNSNNHLRLRRRSYTTISAKLEGITKHDTDASAQKLAAATKKLFKFDSSEPVNDELTGHEQAFQIDLFDTLRQMRGLRKKRQVFTQIYDFASCTCSGIHSKSASILLARWENLKRASNRGASLKIKLKVPPEMMAKISSGECQAPLTSGDNTTSEKGVDSTLQAASHSAVQATQTRAEPAPLLNTSSLLVVHSQTVSPPTPGQVARGISTNTLEQCSTSETIESTMSPSPGATLSLQKSPAFISPEHIEQLRKLEAQLPNQNGKWNRIFAEYTRLYPDPEDVSFSYHSKLGTNIIIAQT